MAMVIISIDKWRYFVGQISEVMKVSTILIGQLYVISLVIHCQHFTSQNVGETTSDRKMNKKY